MLRSAFRPGKASAWSSQGGGRDLPETNTCQARARFEHAHAHEHACARKARARARTRTRITMQGMNIGIHTWQGLSLIHI
eukprot:1878791-Lingulodinium_polyedra.AAC.1